MVTKYQPLLDMLKPQEEEPMMSQMTPEQLSSLQQAPVQAMPENYNQLAQEEALDQPVVEAAPAAPKQTQSSAPVQDDLPKLPMQDTPLSKSEALLAEYQKMLGKDQESLAEARSRDRMLKVGGAIGDALATYLNARSQMNVKAPGVQVQQGAGLGKVADMFATAPEIASDVAARRENLMKQYAELAKGERSQANIDLQKELAKNVDLRTRELAKEKNEATLKAAGIRASTKAGEPRTLEEKEQAFERRERIKAQIKQESKISEENRKLKNQLEPAIATVDDQIKNVKDALNLINKSKIAGTGPLDQYFAGATPEGQLLKKALGNIQLDTLVTKFQGMSRAVDTETDRKFFQETQPSMGNFETTNKKMLNDILKRLEGIKERSQNKLKEISSQNQVKNQPVETQQRKVTNLVKIKGPSGQEATMTEEKAQKYLSKPGYTRIE